MRGRFSAEYHACAVGRVRGGWLTTSESGTVFWRGKVDVAKRMLRAANFLVKAWDGIKIVGLFVHNPAVRALACLQFEVAPRSSSAPVK